MSNSVYGKLDKIRKPRVQISYDVETDGASEKKELPFVAGVMGDYSGNKPGAAKESLKTREFVQIDQDNFDDVMRQIKPGLSLSVKNKVDAEGGDMAVDLEFNSIDDFSPDQVVMQVPALKKLLETRNRLKDLASKSDVSGELESILEEVLTNTESLAELGSHGQDSETNEEAGQAEEGE